MSEQNQEFDPRDTNKDGKVSVKEMLQDAAGKASEAIGKAATAVKGDVDHLVGKVKDYQALSPEEKKAKEAGWNAKATEIAGKASEKAKEIFAEFKEGAERVFHPKSAATPESVDVQEQPDGEA